ncbi:class I SAM-dependent methyltransferase [Flavobacteriaceae bacterium]|jgi:SAM-dependent methyltransferase|nr:class I SAM-dependent methyltransferase [Flavobacteriaceae bacterium]MBT4313953.1 class I SAM-dependent methyltransferase [Flavobacteriaceae bacterium]MBT5091103.1 class I SAM-dependent methyltransferase [Flavobacteriaceae bacterium]MBT5282690.1 class I SAM-dependent methyltransferase [Flavobacteriaceae bacterium]MBT5446896.1 class I SAM-dependent methyltransferase [Flavobacteriaceae bacterium]|tara:strand:+ start:5177 stop:5929 length:753 start_codon:yes stop_codon:yes gene_type:complete
MKWMLNLIPRPLLISMSIWFRPLIKLYFKGNQFTDPIDGSSYRKFLSYGYQNLRENALCPGTLSLERHRLLWLYLTRKTNFLNQSLKVLHIAPEQVFYTKFKAIKDWEYTTTDLHSPLADIKADICALPFNNDQYDLIFCNHVLEHIPDDKKAMEELYRVLKKGGTLIAQVPLNEELDETFEDDTITDKKERTRIFGQYDHVRVYGKDYYTRLNTVGFESKGITFINTMSIEEIDRFGLPQKERIPVAVK